MRDASPALQTFLENSYGAAKANLYTFALSTGVAYRWTNTAVTVVVNGLTYSVGPTLKDSGVTLSRGLDVDNLEITIGSNFIMPNGVPLMAFIRVGGLDGATVTAERAFAPDFASPFVGSYVRFAGRSSEPRSISRSGAVVVVSSYSELLTQNVPSELYQASCSNQLYDAVCQVSKASYTASATVAAGSTATVVALSIHPAASLYSNGVVLFTSGQNAGLRRSIKANDASGNFTLFPPLPFTPQTGDAVTVGQGCDRTRGAAGCAKFNNLANFRGEPYVPNPTTILGGTVQ